MMLVPSSSFLKSLQTAPKVSGAAPAPMPVAAAVPPKPVVTTVAPRSTALPMISPTFVSAPQPVVIESGVTRERFLADMAVAAEQNAVPRCNTCSPVIRANAQPITTTPSMSTSGQRIDAQVVAPSPSTVGGGSGLLKEIGVGLIVALVIFLLIGR